MNSKKIYIVRHGQTMLNASLTHQYPHTELSPHGRTQADAVAKRFKNIDIDMIIASPFMRAKQTAEAIAQETGKPLELFAPLHEQQSPSEILGKQYDDPTIAGIKQKIRENFHKKTWKHSDEETFLDMTKRAETVLHHIISLPYQHIAVVSHGNFIRMMLGTMLWGQDFRPEDYLRFNMFFKTVNTGITVCTYEDGNWRLITWNDHVHLG